jgi:hypothetical protein
MKSRLILLGRYEMSKSRSYSYWIDNLFILPKMLELKVCTPTENLLTAVFWNYGSL